MEIQSKVVYFPECLGGVGFSIRPTYAARPHPRPPHLGDPPDRTYNTMSGRPHELVTRGGILFYVLYDFRPIVLLPMVGFLG